jgi:hypothetical protein
MIGGVVFFTSISGALSSILTEQDASNAAMSEKMLFLHKLQTQYRISPGLSQQIKHALNYDNKTTMVGLDDFVNSLPQHLSMDVTLAIHAKVFHHHPLMKRLKNKRLLSFLGQRLRPQFNYAGTYVYR